MMRADTELALAANADALSNETIPDVKEIAFGAERNTCRSLAYEVLDDDAYGIGLKDTGLIANDMPADDCAFAVAPGL
jgi:hypothetical protein